MDGVPQVPVSAQGIAPAAIPAPVFRASGFENLIGLVVLVLWVVGNITSAAAKKRQGPPPAPGPFPRLDESDEPLPPIAPPRAPEDELRDFLRQLARGGVPDEPDVPPPTPPPMPRPVPRPTALPTPVMQVPRHPRSFPVPASSSPVRRRIERAWRTAAQMQSPPPAPRPPPMPVARPVTERAAPAAAEPAWMATGVDAVLRDTVRPSIPMMPKLPSLHLPRVSLGGGAVTSLSAPRGTSGRRGPAALRNFHGLKQAFVLQSILASPRAVQPYGAADDHGRF